MRPTNWAERGTQQQVEDMVNMDISTVDSKTMDLEVEKHARYLDILARV